jgi:hypothetical protein
MVRATTHQLIPSSRHCCLQPNSVVFFNHCHYHSALATRTVPFLLFIDCYEYYSDDDCFRFYLNNHENNLDHLRPGLDDDHYI